MRHEQPSLSFINSQTGEILTDIWKDLVGGYWKFSNFTHHESNVVKGVRNRADYEPVLPNLVPIETRQKWNIINHKIEEEIFTPQIKESGIEDFLIKSKNFFDKFSNKKIGVQLSGGVDSSIIIGLLKFFEIPHALIGYYTHKYEFRTELFIQKLLASNAQQSILINYEDYLPYSGLENIPPHQHPDMTCCGFSSNQAMAGACFDAGVNVLLTGCGGDLALGDKIIPSECNWIPAIFNYTWLQDIIYTPKGVHLVSFFSDPAILECIWNLRRGQQADPEKLWARAFLRDFLPKELVDYTYKADFWGLYIDGLIKSLPEIHAIHRQAYELSGNPYFEEANLKDILRNDLFNCDQKLYQRLEARISAAVWINSLLAA